MKFPMFRSEHSDEKIAAVIGVTEGTKRKLVAIMDEQTADEVVAALIEERYQEQVR